MILRSPVSGRILTAEAHALTAPGERWPVIDGIAFLRADRRDLADRVLAALDAGDPDTGLMLLLGDQDNWARTPPSSEAARREVIRRRDGLTFRAAMDLLAFGPVGTYFAHRWSDPTFLSGLALAQSHWNAPRRVLELACGAGHYLRAFAPHAEGVTGGDLVFAKLWLARHFIAPSAELVCFDAAAPWPILDGSADLLFCHDAFYFLPEKQQVAREMQRVAPVVLVGHAHNALVETLSSGEPLDPAGYAGLFPGSVLFDDRELTLALIEARRPVAASAEALADAPAVTLASGAMTGVAAGPLTAPAPGVRLRRNPLYSGGRVAWPSDRYRVEYGGLATYPAVTDAPEAALAGANGAVDVMARDRVLLDLPERW